MTSPGPTVDALLDAAVTAMGGSQRPGQHEMATAVAGSITAGEHLLVQAGTGTGKSLAYLVPALQHTAHTDTPVVVATATIALQRQLVERDLPMLVDVLEPLLGHRPTFTLLKGRQNYLCLQRLAGGDDASPDDDVLFEPAPTSPAGRDALRIREWAETTSTGDRDELVPAPDERAWRSLSVSAHECLGAQRCPMAAECYVEVARERAREADVVVTNHAMLAIDALSEARLLPEHDVVVVDEGHELADRATGAVTDELTAGLVERAARRSRRLAGDRQTDLLLAAAGLLEAALAECEAGRLRSLPSPLFDALVAVRDAGHAALTAIGSPGKDGDDLAAKVRARAAVEEVHEIAGRIVAAGEHDVVWVTRPDRRPPSLWRAPMQVGGLLAEQLFGQRTVVVTSATLMLGGLFEPLARTLGLGDATPWRGVDVGSPFDYPKQGILYVAAHLPPPGRDGLSPSTLDELTELVEAADGRTLGLFSSMRAAQQAAEELRTRVDLPILCQGDDATAELVRQFAADARTCLFGTLSLWQGVDVPGSALHLVVIDRVPFPRPDDPLASARQEAVARAGGNGFMAVAASQAALRLAQGAGRLIRTTSDRGVVAVLDSRLATARYAGYLRGSLPPMWPTTDGALVRRSLAAIAAEAPPVLPVREQVAAEAAASTSRARRARATPTAATTDGDNRRRRWTADDEAALLAGFDAGTPVSLLADELGRSHGAVVERIKSHSRAGAVTWGSGLELPQADRALPYALALVTVPAQAAGEELAVRVAEMLEAEGWDAEADAALVRVRRGPVDAVAGWGEPEDLLLGDATSRFLLRPAAGAAPDTSCPAGVDAVVTLPVLGERPAAGG